jgi:tetratricopeptide (TPR) repeat protein
MTDVSPIKIIKILTPYILLDFLLLILWQTNAGHTANIIQSIQSFQLSFFDWSANFFRMTAWYIKNLFVPGNIAFEYSQAPVIGLSYLWNFVPWTILAGSTLLVIYHFKRSAVSFAVIIFLTGFIYAAPASLSHPDIGMVFEPHWLYFSSIGFFLLIALALLKLKGCINRLLYLALASSILISFYLSTEALHLMAKNELDYCENWLRVSPHNTYAMSLLAQDYSSDKSIAIPTDLIPDMLNAIDLLIKNDYFISAPKLIGKLSSYPLSPAQRWQLLLRSAVDHCKYGTQGQCAEISERIVHSSNDPGNYIQLSYLLDEFDIDGQALALLGQCMARYPDYKEAYLLDGIILANQQHYTESIAVWERGLKIAPGDQRFIANIDKARSLSSGS